MCDPLIFIGFHAGTKEGVELVDVVSSCLIRIIGDHQCDSEDATDGIPIGGAMFPVLGQPYLSRTLRVTGSCLQSQWKGRRTYFDSLAHRRALN